MAPIWVFLQVFIIFFLNNRPIMRLFTVESHFAHFQRIFKVVYQFFSAKSFHSSSYYRCLIKFSLENPSTLPLFTNVLNFFRKKFSIYLFFTVVSLFLSEKSLHFLSFYSCVSFFSLKIAAFCVFPRCLSFCFWKIRPIGVFLQMTINFFPRNPSFFVFLKVPMKFFSEKSLYSAYCWRCLESF